MGTLPWGKDRVRFIHYCHTHIHTHRCKAQRAGFETASSAGLADVYFVRCL